MAGLNRPLRRRPRMALHMIVRDEAARIERCLASVLPVIDSWIIVDTGSKDDTPERIAAFFEREDLPGELAGIELHSFGQTRNEALDKVLA